MDNEKETPAPSATVKPTAKAPRKRKVKPPVPELIRCVDCKFHNMAVSRALAVHGCHRFPQVQTIQPDYWCGEFTPKVT